MPPMNRTLRTLLLPLLLVFLVTESHAQRGQIATLNHFLAVIDDETAEAVKNSVYLREFANFYVRTVTANEGQMWTGRYLSGRETYVELFAVRDLEESRVGAVSIGIGGDVVGVTEELVRRLQQAGLQPRVTMRKRRFGDREIDWFKSARVANGADADSISGVFSLEYVESYMDDPAAEKEPPTHPHDVSRERYQSDDYAKHLMRDVRSVEGAVTMADSVNIEAMLRAAGFQVSRTPTVLKAHGAAMDLAFQIVSEAQIGLRRVTFVLNREVKTKHVEAIGRSVLSVGPGTVASWDFGDAALSK